MEVKQLASEDRMNQAFPSDFDIIDISQSVGEHTACFPGDVPFSKSITCTFAETNVINLSAIKMSPHIGTHADAPSHVKGDFEDHGANAGALPLVAYVGPATVIDLSPMKKGAVTADALRTSLSGRAPQPRVLLKTQAKVEEEKFKDDYPYIGVDAVQFLAEHGVQLIGIDTPSVDHINSKGLETHHELIKQNFFWLENLNLEHAPAGDYFLVAAPLKLVSAEAAPVRALLLRARS